MSDGVTPTEVKVENIYGIARVDYTFDPAENCYLITGANGAGKSSLMDAIWLAFGGPKAKRKGADSIVHDGEAVGTVELTLSNGWILKRRFADKVKQTDFEILIPEGVRVPSPQTVLDKMIGDSLGIDPKKFAEANDDEARTLVLRALGLESALVELKRQYKEAFDERTHVGRSRDQSKAAVLEAGAIDEAAPEEPLDVQALADEYTKAALVASNRETAERTIAAARNELEHLKAQALSLKKTIEDWTAWLAGNPLVDSAPIRAQMLDANELNLRVFKNRERTELLKAHARDATKYEEATALLHRLKSQRSELLARSDVSVPGLTIGEEGEILFDGRRPSALSFGERYKAGCAVAMTGARSVNVIHIEQGGELDEDTLGAIVQMAAERGFKVFVQRPVKEWDGKSIHLKAGRLVTKKKE